MGHGDGAMVGDGWVEEDAILKGGRLFEVRVCLEFALHYRCFGCVEGCVYIGLTGRMKGT